MRSVLLSSTALLILTGCPPTSNDECGPDNQCRSSKDCIADEVCRECDCIPPCFLEECETDADCEPAESCNDCVCVGEEGESESESESEGEGSVCHDPLSQKVKCLPSLDITSTEVSCADGATTVRVTVAEDPETNPSLNNSRHCQFLGKAGDLILELRAVAVGGPYSCESSAGELAKGDSCGISTDGSAWEFTLTPETAGKPLSSFSLIFLAGQKDGVYSANLGPLPITCQP